MLELSTPKGQQWRIQTSNPLFQISFDKINKAHAPAAAISIIIVYIFVYRNIYRVATDIAVAVYYIK